MGVAMVHEFQNNNEALCLRPIEPELINASVLVWKKDQRNAAAVQKVYRIYSVLIVKPSAGFAVFGRNFFKRHGFGGMG